MHGHESIFEVLTARMRQSDCETAIFWNGGRVSYRDLLQRIESVHIELDAADVRAGHVVLLEADFSPAAVACLIALFERRAIVALATGIPADKCEQYAGLCEASTRIRLLDDDRLELQSTSHRATHPLVVDLARRFRAGVIIFSSGATGTSKASLHEIAPLLEKFRTPGRNAKVVAFLLLDHIGGLNLLFYTLFSGGAIVVPEDRSPDSVCDAIARCRATALTTTPTFLRLALLARAFDRHDVSSLEIINYSSEVMPEGTLRAVQEALPGVRLSQSYGLTEVGVLPVRSTTSDSVLLRVVDGSQVRVRDGMLEVKTSSTMLGYLNAPSPFTEDGWFRTGDLVELDGECLRVLGRASELINVGGTKVYPAEVEDVVQELDGVLDVIASGVPHVITGQLVQVAVRLSTNETLLEFARRMRSHCSQRLPSYMVPQKVLFLDESAHGRRFKKLRQRGTKHDNP